MLDKEEIVALIAAKTSMNREDIEKMVEKEVEKYSGMLTENGAALLVAKQLNIKLDNKKELSKIGLLREGMHGINIKAEINRIYPPKKIKKGNKELLLSIVELSDESGKIRLKLWNENAKRLYDEKVEKGWIADVKGAYVGAYNKEAELNLNFDSEISFLKKEGKAIEISSIKAGMKDIDLYCRIKNIYEERKFKKGFNEGRVIAFEVEDLEGNSSMRAVAWDDAVDEILPLKKGNNVKIESAYSKENKGKIELHLGWKSRVIVEPCMAEQKDI